ncbi:benzoate/H(+) symporter BenE family transporter [Poseidonocella sedimentorum]|uniref:Benzoate membrane transport protein n=1 Tax=Poseidonocella sedimentorum TaxID=871652 RepID=A0A1I6EC80_9RHOB|nr:benzoate/H(+) symporter BenE family transporter [Poseidonocella sedimentorum]SFR15247.1 benzoate membrane transport protein [Poseidonocella sedimentorum]
MLRELSPSAIYMGLLAAFVGYSASFAIVLAGVTRVGATPDQAATALFFATLGMGVGSLWLPLATRSPAAVAWSTPGAALLAASAAPAGGFGAVVAALIGCAALIAITGVVPLLGRIVAAIPKPVANALLAGVLFPLCLAPAHALGAAPLLFLPVLGAWVAGLLLHRLAAMPLAVLAFILVMIFAVDLPADALGDALGGSLGLPALAPVAPEFSLAGLISLALPLYLVTMAGQNIPGFALLELQGYPVDRQAALRKTGLASLVAAPFGAIPINMSAITAALMAGPDAHPDRSRRYWAAVVSGLGYVGLALLAEPVTQLAQAAPSELIIGVAGLALIPALVAALSAGFSEPGSIEAPALTFLITASGMTLLGISGAFWGIVIGVLIWGLKRGLKRR